MKVTEIGETPGVGEEDLEEGVVDQGVAEEKVAARTGVAILQDLAM
jgi:hypothetical protein